jgi:hypothetical protein
VFFSLPKPNVSKLNTKKVTGLLTVAQNVPTWIDFSMNIGVSSLICGAPNAGFCPDCCKHGMASDTDRLHHDFSLNGPVGQL